MDVEEIKKLDKRILEIQNPFGNGFPALRKVFEETAEKNQCPVADVVRRYLIWKWRK
ncbi:MULTISPECIES: hypothetical protein [Acutalibacteraceae]|uniref:hypothetical protein n=1 Tax=Acutalibacteraceae TaxID=3082771 RepID=UPI0013E8AAAA|nr:MULTISPECIES: hypothetical protein [Acutalibacteraceae]